MKLRIVSLIALALNIGLINSCVRSSDTVVTTTTAATTGMVYYHFLRHLLFGHHVLLTPRLAFFHYFCSRLYEWNSL